MTRSKGQPDDFAHGQLSVLGVPPQGERLYLRLLTGGPASTAELTAATGLSISEVEQLIAVLAHDGLLSTVGGNPVHWVANPPQYAVEGLIQLRERELAAARRAMTALVADRLTVSTGSTPGGPVELLDSPDALARRFAELEAGVQREMLVLSKAPFLRRSDRTEEVLGVLERKVDCRSVYDRSALDRPGALRTINEFQSAGEQIRVADELPMKLLIADGRIALVPVGPQRPGAWIAVHRSDLLAGLLSLFELIWSGAVPLSAGPRRDGARDPLPQEDVELLALLFAGLTDAAIARQTDASVRTVQRRVTRLMRRAGVQSRAQLAWQAARWGWLGE